MQPGVRALLVEKLHHSLPRVNLSRLNYGPGGRIVLQFDYPPGEKLILKIRNK